jgi:hypothetical protein
MGLKSKLPYPDMQAAPRALLRAARRARQIAFDTNTPLVIVRDGVLVHEMVTDVDDPELAAAMRELDADDPTS